MIRVCPRHVGVLVALVLGVWSVLAGRAAAHPHVFIQARAEVVYDGNGNVTAIRHHWRFDDVFSAFAIQGLDKNGDGTYTREELAELAEINISSLADFGYFTFGDDTKVEIDFNAPKDYWLDMVTIPVSDYWAMSDEDLKAIAEDAEKSGIKAITEVQLLELHFTLPLKATVGSTMPVTFDVYDPTYYIDFRFGKEAGAITLKDGPQDCRITTREPKELDEETAARLGAIGADVRDLPPELRAITETLVNQMVISCGDAVAAVPAAPSEAAPSAPADGASSASDAVMQMAAGGNPVPLTPGDAATSAPEASTSAAADTSGAAPATEDIAEPQGYSGGGFFGGILAKITEAQTAFYKKLVSALRRFKTDPSAVWFLFLLSFGYGVFHAAGPGHGKAIITSYMFANETTLRRGVVLSFAAAFVQATVAVAIVTIVALVLRGTSIAMKSTLGVFEAGSFALVALLGAWLVWRKTRAFLRLKPVSTVGAAHVGDPHLASHSHHHDHHHGHDHGHAHDHGHGEDDCCGHSHVPEPAAISGKLSLREAAAAVFSIGMRPCSGALVVLVFALSQGLYLAGVASAYVMSIGTALTISTLAIIAVTSRGLAMRIIGAETLRGRRIFAGLEIAAAFVVFLVGVVFFIAALQAPTTL